MTKTTIFSLSDLALLRGALELSPEAYYRKRYELPEDIVDANWVTVGVIAPSAIKALEALRAGTKSRLGNHERG